MSQQRINVSHPMKTISISKAVINIGVGKSGEPLEKAKQALQELTGQLPTVRGARKTVRDFGIHKGEPIGALVTLRRKLAVDFLKRAIGAKGNILQASSFDNFGNFSLGIHEHIDLPGVKYNPDIGIFGMDISIALTRPGYRIAKKRHNSRVGRKHRITKEEAIQYFRQEFGAEIITNA